MSHGVRIVAAYGDEIVLFSVPVDLILWSRAEQEDTIHGGGDQFRERHYVQLLRHPTSNAKALIESSEDADVAFDRFEELNTTWAHYLPVQSGSKPTEWGEDVWPIQIKGVSVGSLNGVRLLAVQEDEVNGLIIWAFAGSGVAKAWKVDDGRGPLARVAPKATTDGILREV